MRRAVQAELVAALLQEIAREQEIPEIGEHVEKLQLDDDAATLAAVQGLVEGEKLRREQCRHVQIDAEGVAQRGVVVLRQIRDHASVQVLREVLEQPLVRQHVDRRAQDLAERLDGCIDLVKDGLRPALARHRAHRLAPDDGRQVGVGDGLFDGGQIRRVEGLGRRRRRLAVLCGRDVLAIMLGARAHHLVGQAQERLVVPFEIEPLAERGATVLVGLQQGVFAEQIAQMQHRVVQFGHACAVADHDQVVVEQAEQCALEVADHAVEGRHGDANVVLAPIVGAQVRQTHVHGPSPAREAAQALDEIEKRGLLTHRGRLRCPAQLHACGTHPAGERITPGMREVCDLAIEETLNFRDFRLTAAAAPGGEEQGARVSPAPGRGRARPAARPALCGAGGRRCSGVPRYLYHFLE